MLVDNQGGYYEKTIKITTSLLLSFACVFSIGDFTKPHTVEAETVYSLTDSKPINEIFPDPKLAQVVANWLKLPLQLAQLRKTN